MNTQRTVLYAVQISDVLSPFMTTSQKQNLLFEHTQVFSILNVTDYIFCDHFKVIFIMDVTETACRT